MYPILLVFVAGMAITIGMSDWIICHTASRPIGRQPAMPH